MANPNPFLFDTPGAGGMEPPNPFLSGEDPTAVANPFLSGGMSAPVAPQMQMQYGAFGTPQPAADAANQATTGHDHLATLLATSVANSCWTTYS